MTLREIHSVLSRIPFDRAMVTQTGQILGNLNEFKAAVQALAPIPHFAPMVKVIQESPLYTTGADSNAFRDNANTWKEAADLVILSARGLEQLLDNMLPKTPPESIVVKLPPDQALSYVAELLQELQKVLGQLVALEGIEGDVQITSWETGSLLVLLYLKSLAAVDLVGRALRAGAIVYQEIQKGRLLGQHVRLLKVKVESAQDLQEAQEKLLKEIVEHQARTVESETFPSHNPERLERLKVCVRTLANLLDRGTTIYPTVEMPTESKEKFPDLDRINVVLSEMKQLEDATPTDNSKAHDPLADKPR